MASESRGASRDSRRSTKRSVDSCRWGWPSGYIARLWSTIENSTRKSAKSRESVVTERAPCGGAPGTGEGEPGSSCLELRDMGIGRLRCPPEKQDFRHLTALAK